MDGQCPAPPSALANRAGLKQKRRYQRTQVIITSGSNFRFQNKGGRHELMAYATKSPAATLPLVVKIKSIENGGARLLAVNCQTGAETKLMVNVLRSMAGARPKAGGTSAGT